MLESDLTCHQPSKDETLSTMPSPPPPPGENEPQWNQPRQPYNQPYGSGPYGDGPYSAPPPAPTSGPKNKWLIPVIAGGAALLLIIVLVVALIHHSSKTPATSVITAAPPPAAAVTTAPAGAVPGVVTTPPVTTTTAPVGVEGSPRAGADDTKYLEALLLTDDNGVDHSTYWASRESAQQTDVLQLGYAICSAYDEGATPQQIVDAMTDKGIPSTEANWARAASVVFLCPEHKSS